MLVLAIYSHSIRRVKHNVAKPTGFESFESLWPVGGLRVGILSKDVDACATKQCVIARVEGARKALT